MKITAIETLRTLEFSNVLWARVHTDAGTIGLGETFYGAGAVEAHIHDTLAARLLGRDPLRIEAIHRDLVNRPMAQSSTGVEYRAASAIDIALWDLFGKLCGQPVRRRRPLRGPRRPHAPRRRGCRKPARVRHHRHEDVAVRPGRPGHRRPAHQRRPAQDRARTLRELWNLPTAKRIAKALEPYAPPGSKTPSA